MIAHDFVRQPHTEISSKTVYCSITLAVFKLLRCTGVFIISSLLERIHVISLLFLVKLSTALLMLVVHKPFTSGVALTRSQWRRLVQHAILITVSQILWFYGITLCGPLRSILVYEHSTAVVFAALSAAFLGSGGSSRLRGAVLFLFGFLSLILLDRDVTLVHVHVQGHKHHIGLNHVFYHLIDWFGIADHKAGVFVLALALLLRACAENTCKRLVLDIGGAKRLTSMSSLVSAVLLFPIAIVVFFAKKNIDVPSWPTFITLLVNAVLLVFVFDFYMENMLSKHLQQIFVSRYCPCLMFVLSFVVSKVWFEPYRASSPLEFFIGMHLSGPVEHRISGGVLFSLILFVFATISLTAPVSPKATAAQFVGYSSAGLPLYVYGEDFLQKTSQSIALFVKNALRQILSNRDSTKIFYFLCLNLCFTFVEFAYGAWTNSLGLISDAFHMLFDCSALVMGLVASVMSTWKPTQQFSYGYGRLEILSGFVNALFLVIIASFIFFEALLRIFDPPEVYTEKLLFVSVGGLIVNLFGLLAFHSSHDHDHGHGHSHNGGSSSSHLPSHGHSHPHGHSHSGNANMKGVFLHVMADTLGSVAVIISSILIQKLGWLIADPLCSLLLSLLIAASVIPLLRDSTSMLLLKVPDELGHEADEAVQKILSLNGAVSYSDSRIWQLKSGSVVGSLKIQADLTTDQQTLTQQASNILRCAGVNKPVVQVEKESFYYRITTLCSAYEFPPRVTQNRMVVSAPTL